MVLGKADFAYFVALPTEFVNLIFFNGCMYVHKDFIYCFNTSLVPKEKRMYCMVNHTFILPYPYLSFNVFLS